MAIISKVPEFGTPDYKTTDAEKLHIFEVYTRCKPIMEANERRLIEAGFVSVREWAPSFEKEHPLLCVQADTSFEASTVNGLVKEPWVERWLIVACRRAKEIPGRWPGFSTKLAAYEEHLSKCDPSARDSVVAAIREWIDRDYPGITEDAFL